MVLGPARWSPWLRAGISAESSVAYSSPFFNCTGHFCLEGRAVQHSPFIIWKLDTIFLEDKSNDIYPSCKNSAEVFFLELPSCSVSSWEYSFKNCTIRSCSQASKLHKILHTAYCTSQGNNTFNNCSWSNVSSLTAISNSSKGSVSSFFEENQHIIKHHWKQQENLRIFHIGAIKAINVSYFIDKDTSDSLWIRRSVFTRQHRHLKA